MVLAQLNRLSRTRHDATRVLQRLRKTIIKPTHHFIHIPKNGGISIREALGGKVSLSSPAHFRYVDIADQVGRHLKFFTVIRNPWSRTLSRYRFALEDAARWSPDDPRGLYIRSATFTDFVRDQKIFDIPEHPGQPWMGPMNSWFNQLEWIRDESGTVVCDCLRLEHLADDVAAYFGTRVRLPQRNASKNGRDYRCMYTDELAEIVANTFRADIEHFGFTFSGSATRGIAV